MKSLSSALLWLALWLGASPEVRAEPASALSAELHGDLPFGRAELEDALLPRLDDASVGTRAAARGVVVEVSATGAGVLVRVGARARTVPLGERTGPGAARVVALVILDLVLSEGPALPMPLPMPPPAGEDAELMAGTAPATAPRSAAGTAPATAPHTAAGTAPATAPHTAAGTAPATAPHTPAAPAQPANAPPANAPATTAQPATAPATTARPAAGPPARPKPLAFEPPPPVPTAQPAAAVPAPRLAPPGVAARPAPASMTRPASRLGSRSATAPTRTVTHVRLSGFGGTVLGAASDQATMVSAGADARLGLGSWRAGAGLSWLHLPVTSYAQTDIGLDGATLRLDAGRAFGDVELTAAAFATPSRLRTDVTGSPREYHDTLLFGGGAAVRAGARLGGSWLLVATAGVDVFGRRLRVRTPDEVLTSTPLVTISLAVGVSWEVMP
jgi:hypothetical protein